ncbi:MAG: type II toxin-antitoxin system VapC family toxin [Bacteroidota bacterium]
MNGDIFLVDTNIIVDFFKGDPAIASNLAISELFIPSIVVGELYFGAYASSITYGREKRLKEIAYFLEQYPIVEVSEKTANYYGQIKSQLKQMGKPIPENDVWIAALAKEYNLPIASRDKHFEYVSELGITVWQLLILLPDLPIKLVLVCITRIKSTFETKR